MTNKRTEIKRLLLYLIFAFVPPYVLAFIYTADYGWKNDNPWFGVITSVSMFFPAAANIITRLITKEGFSKSLLRIRLKGNMRYFVIALLLPVVCSVITAVIMAAVLLPSGSLGNMVTKMDYGKLAATVLYVITMSIVFMLFGFGEEFGWRGYLTPKLEKLMPAPAAIIVSGIIWGLWHAPIVACGHNFGTNYAGFPWLGIILMCISCIGFGLYLTALTRITGSVLTASIAHISINNIIGATSGAMLMSVDGYESISEKLSSGIEYPLLTMIVLFVMSITEGMVLLIIKKRKKKNTVSDNSKVKE